MLRQLLKITVSTFDFLSFIYKISADKEDLYDLVVAYLYHINMHLLTYLLMASLKEDEKVKGSAKCRFKSICVFGGSTLGKERKFIKVASDLGKELADRGINLVYGGGLQGLRGCAATTAFYGGSNVLSVTLKDYPYSTLGTELKVLSLPEHFGHMFRNAEAFIALPGGLETLAGISNITFWAKLNLHKKPLGLLNINGFYDGLLAFLDQAVEQGFILPEIRRAIISASTVDQLIDQLQSYEPEPSPLGKPIDGQPSDNSKKQKLDTTLRL